MSRTRLLAWPHFCLAAIVGVAVVLRGWGLGEHGFITPYYLAGVRSMLQSWHNLLFNAFDPAGFVSLDKPPVAFWIQTASARLFGFGPFSVLLPQLLEGVAAIVLLYALVRHRFGEAAGLLAALFLALNPISVAVDRSNNTESCLVLVLLAAAWALLRAVETGRLWFLLLAAALVGLGFNVKMLVAFGVVPIFGLVYLLGAVPRWPLRIGQLAAAGAVLAVVSASWLLLYDLTPAQERPFVDSTRDNSMIELVVGHNGIQRFVRRDGGRRQAIAANRPIADNATDNAATPANTPPAALPTGRDFAPAGPLRLAAPRLASQIGWLFPVALLGGIAAWLRTWREEPRALRLDLLLWSGWAVSYGIVFSAADGLFHSYYLVVMAPAVCALAGIGVAALWASYRDGSAAAYLLPAAIVPMVLWQLHILGEYITGHLTIGPEYLEPLCILAAVSVAVALVAWRQSVTLAASLSAVAAAVLLLLPAAWSVGTTLTAGNTGFPSARPPFLTAAAEGQRQRWGMVAGALAPDPKLLGFLHDRHGDEDFLMASVNARLAAPVIIATGQPVMALGGFSGGDPILDVDDFARLVAEKRVRFALVGDGSPGLRRIFGDDRQKPLVDWIRANGRPVEPALWRAPTTTDAPAQRRPRSAEAADAQLYDLRPEPEPR